MESARNVRTGQVVNAADADARDGAYLCWRPGCGGRVYLPNVHFQRPHFRHYPGEGTPACDEYYPGGAFGYGAGAPSEIAVEDDSGELGLLVDQVDRRWTLLLRVPELPEDALAGRTLSALRDGLVDVFVGGARSSRLSALEIRPGTDAARVEVAPTLRGYRTQAAGRWPEGIDQTRWNATASPLVSRGAAFRLWRGEWARLRESSSVQAGEPLIIIADARCAPPPVCVVEEGDEVRAEGVRWTLSRVQLPDKVVGDVARWLEALGYPVSPRAWLAAVVSVPCEIVSSTTSRFVLDEPVVVALTPPTTGASAMLALNLGTNTHTLSTGSVSDSLFVALSPGGASTAQLEIGGERAGGLEWEFVVRANSATVSERLRCAPRLRASIGAEAREAWSHTPAPVSVLTGDVRIATGVEGARVDVVLRAGKARRVFVGLTTSDAERAIAELLNNADAVEIDAGNLGHVEFARGVHAGAKPSAHAERLGRWRGVVASLSRARGTPDVVGEAPQNCLRLTRLQASMLTQARMAARRGGQAKKVTP